MKKEILRIENLCTTFRGGKMLSNLRMSIYEGEIRGIIGLNGSGKTTLVKVLAGIHAKDSGAIYFDNKKINIQSSKDANAIGIFTVLKNSRLISNLTVAENIFIGRNLTLKNFIINDNKINTKTKMLLDEFELEINPTIMSSRLTEGQHKLIEILKAYINNAKLLVLDDLIDIFTYKEMTIFLQIIKELKNKGLSIVITNYKFEDKVYLFDRISVIRGGQIVKTLKEEEFDEKLVINLAVGYEFNNIFNHNKNVKKEKALEFFKLSVDNIMDNVNFTVNKGEIIGICDLEGQWSLELVKLLIGSVKGYTGSVFIENKTINLKSLQDTAKSGIGIVSERFFGKQLFNNISPLENLYFPIYKKMSRSIGYISKKVEKVIAEECITQFGLPKKIKDIDTNLLKKNNAYKIIINKWILNKSKIIVMDNPTVGVDIVTKKIIYSILDKACEEGLGIIFISSDISEIINVSDRVLVIKNGEISNEFIVDSDSIKSLYGKII